MDCPHGHGTLRHLFPNDNMTIDNPTHLLYCEQDGCNFMQEFAQLSDIPGQQIPTGIPIGQRPPHVSCTSLSDIPGAQTGPAPTEEDWKAKFEAKCAEAEALRNKARLAWFAFTCASEKPVEFTEAMRAMYTTATLGCEAGKPLLEEMNVVRRENADLRKALKSRTGLSEKVTLVLQSFSRHDRRFRGRWVPSTIKLILTSEGRNRAVLQEIDFEHTSDPVAWQAFVSHAQDWEASLGLSVEIPRLTQDTLDQFGLVVATEAKPTEPGAGGETDG